MTPPRGLPITGVQDSIFMRKLIPRFLVAQLVLEPVSTRCVGFHTELIGVRMSFGDKLLLKFFPKLSLHHEVDIGGPSRPCQDMQKIDFSDLKNFNF